MSRECDGMRPREAKLHDGIPHSRKHARNVVHHARNVARMGGCQHAVLGGVYKGHARRSSG